MILAVPEVYVEDVPRVQFTVCVSRFASCLGIMAKKMETTIL